MLHQNKIHKFNKKNEKKLMAIKDFTLVWVLRQQSVEKQKYSMTQDSIFENKMKIIYLLFFKKNKNIFLQDDEKKKISILFIQFTPSTRRCRAFFFEITDLRKLFSFIYTLMCVSTCHKYRSRA